MLTSSPAFSQSLRHQGSLPGREQQGRGQPGGHRKGKEGADPLGPQPCGRTCPQPAGLRLGWRGAWDSAFTYK